MTQRGGSPEFPYYEDETRAPAPLSDGFTEAIHNYQEYKSEFYAAAKPETVTGRALKDIAYWLKWFEDAWRGEMAVNKTLHVRAETAEAALTQAQAERDEAKKDKHTIGKYFGYGDISETLTAQQLAEFLDQKNRESFDSVTTLMKELREKELTTARAEVTKLMEAIEPFARKAAEINFNVQDTSDSDKYFAAAGVYEQVKRDTGA